MASERHSKTIFPSAHTQKIILRRESGYTLTQIQPPHTTLSLTHFAVIWFISHSITQIAGALDVGKESADQQIRSFVSKEVFFSLSLSHHLFSLVDSIRWQNMWGSNRDNFAQQNCSSNMEILPHTHSSAILGSSITRTVLLCCALFLAFLFMSVLSSENIFHLCRKLGNGAFYISSIAQHSFAAIDPLITIFGHQINGGL